MTFQFYRPFYSKKEKKFCPGVNAVPLTDEQTFRKLCASTEANIAAYRQGDKEAKLRLPAVTWCGVSHTGRRMLADMSPSGYYIADIDHMAVSPLDVKIANPEAYGIRLMHVTPSGRGLRIVARFMAQRNSIAEHMQWLEGELKLSELGKFDMAVKDVSRLSFVPRTDDIIYLDPKLFTEEPPPPEWRRLDSTLSTDTAAAHATLAKSAAHNAVDPETVMFRGWKVSDIVAQYVKRVGEPTEGERHLFYNSLCKDFRNLVDNNPYRLAAVLPAFEGTDESRLSQCKSICRSNTSARLPWHISKFLIEEGFDTEPTEDKPEQKRRKIPPLPPVFKEFVRTAPEDFRFPLVQSLLPILGTLTSHLRSKYWYDGREHSTQFFSVVYGASGMGKGFVERAIDMLLQRLQLRDELSSAREQLYNKIVSTNKKNDKDPENPKVSLRIIEPKCSEADFLEKQAANNGHHMFTFAAEMDQWRKGVRAAGGNKDDMLRIAWDNGMYGQNFKSANTFKGRVRLFWNVLITGTKPQLDKYFVNCENGLVGRCGFAEVKNQEFALPPQWGEMTVAERDSIEGFVSRMERMTYGEEIDEFSVNNVHQVSDDEFDNVIKWRHTLSTPVSVDVTWARPTLDKFLEEQRIIAVRDRDFARDSFRRRCAVRGFRLAILCSALYETLGKKEERLLSKFIEWFVNEDIDESLALWREEYNKLYTQKPTTRRVSLFDKLPESFTKEDVEKEARNNGIFSPVRNIITLWKKENLLRKIDAKTYKKIKHHEKNSKN